jgi:ribosomal protein S18 acetylase RimI-like enzyme
MIVYTDSVEGVTPDKLKGFFHGWMNPPSPEAHLNLLRHSEHVVLAVDDASGRVVGFITAITDHVLTAYIPYVEVVLQYRNRGIGRELTRRMLDRLQGYYLVSLVAGTGLQAFYGSFGMTPANAMMLIRPYAGKELKE